MQAAAQDHDLPNNDLGPLAWVLDELRKSLESASSALRRFVRDAAQARGQDMASVDAGQLRIARQHMHQAVGALEMVGMPAPAHMLRSMEAAVQRFVERPELCTEASAAKVERAGFALTEFLEALLGGKAVSPVSLFVQYKDVQDLTGADRIHPADLWGINWQWNDFQAPAAVRPLAYEPAVRSRMDQAVLRIVKTADAAAGRDLAELSVGLAAAQTARQPKIFWKIAGGYFEAIALGLLPADLFVKRAASRVLLQYAALAKGDAGVSERLAQDLVFFCAQAVPARPTDAPALTAVRQGYGLAKARPVDYATSPFGRFDPVLLNQLRKRIATAKETWSGLSGGDSHKVKSVGEQFHALAETLQKLYPGSQPLAQAMNGAIDNVVRSNRAPSAELAMEVATAVLYLEAAFQDLDPNDQQLADRTARLAERLKKVQQGGHPEPLEHWVEDLYRRVSDKQTMGSVVGELRGTMGELEKLLDQFFRDPADKAPLRDAPGFLQQMRGVLSVLGLDQASQAVMRMRETVENIITTDVDEAKARTAGTFEKLGNNLGALGFLIDMLNYQPTLAKKLFIWDDVRGELRPLMGRAEEPAAEAAAPVIEVIAAPSPVAAPVARLPELPSLELPPVVAPAPVAVAPAAVVAAAAPAPVAAVPAPAPVAAKPAPAPVAAAPAADDESDDELLQIFLEEAREVVANGLAALQALADEPKNLPEMTTLRRAFHTLKGSSRMVGLNEFGEAAWSLEQVLNTWLADQKSAGADMRTLCVEAMQGFGRWTDDIAAHTDSQWQAAAFRTAADALRTESRLLPIALPGAAAPAAPAAVEVAAELPVQDEAILSNLVALDSGFADLEPAAAPAAPTMDFADLGFTLDLDPPAARPAEVSFDFDLTPEASLAAPAATEVSELGADDELPPEFAQLAASFAMPEAHPPASLPVPAAQAEPEELPELASTAVMPRLQLDVPAARSEPKVEHAFGMEDIDFASLSAVAGFAQVPAEAAPMAQPEPVAQVQPAVTGAEPEVEPVDSSAPARDEQVKVIGKLRIGIPLYNVYLNEADEWSRRLATEISEWTLEMNQSVPDSTVGWAHALAGSSATVGFQALSDIARALEGALQHTQALADGTPQHARVFTEAAEEVRRLLHQFAAGFLKEPDAVLLQALHALKNAEGDLRTDSRFPPSRLDETDIDVDFDFSPPQAEAVQPAPAETVAPVVIAQPAPMVQPVPVVQPAPVVQAARIAQPALLLQPAPLLQPAAPRAPVVAIEDDEEDLSDVVDAIDPDLFPIFEEEAAELMPALGSALRAWANHPSQREPRDQVLRHLHTLKGSARLAGALQLGELAHRMESEVEYLGSENIAAADVEALLHRFDSMQARFDTLRGTGGFAPAEEPQAIEPAAAPQVVAAQPAVAPQPLQAVPVAAVEPAPVAQQAAPAAQPAPVRTAIAMPAQTSVTVAHKSANQAVRVRSQLLDRLVMQAGEVMITRSRLESELRQLRGSLGDLTGNLDRLRMQLREIEVQAESQMQSRMAQAKDTAAGFDPLEFDRFTRVQELTRLMAESVNDVATVQRNIQRVVEATEDDLVAQARQTRELQRDLLRTRMVEFDGISERLYRVVRLAAKESGKQVKLDIIGGTIEMDRGVLDRMTPAFEHLLRNCVAHGVETPDVRTAAGKTPSGTINVHMRHEGNDVSVEFQDDGAGLDVARIRDKAIQQGLITPQQQLSDSDAANLIFLPGFSTAAQVTELAGRGIGMDVVRAEVNALGGRIETTTQAGRGTSFKLVLPLTTAVTQVVMVRSGKLSIGVPANLVELVRRGSQKEVQQAYNSGTFEFAGEQLPFFWSGALLQSSRHTVEPQTKTLPVVIFRSAAQRVAVHVDEVLGNQEVVVKNLGPQLARLPGLAGMTVLASGAVVLIYNPVALMQVYGEQARALSADRAQPDMLEQTGKPAAPLMPVVPTVPLVLVVDDSITVRRVTQRLLTREGYRVALAADGLQALERLADELPTVVLSDIEMPRMDGFDLARNIRGDVRLAHLPIVMITSRIAEKHREHAKELGVNHYLGKPYSEEELLSLVKHYSAQAVTA
ncbi:Hpt domain-containing protein [Ramlibacter sp.]|uniref:hybrid sensor histidine kinase/response regulator n=1 Tax=Ramlibacter sp. TaxID=1917967 RepID=UPI00262D6A5D|nr:Hpt domain-containing protein [Ramlibacter sp.]MDB5957544.1 putative histidine kinase, CheA [Ramlibacter sp.]